MDTRPNNKVHFIWMGSLKEEKYQAACHFGPSSLAKQSPQTKINMWVPEHLLKDAETLFKDYPNIQICSIDRMLNGEYGPLQHIENPKLIKDLLSEQDKARSFAAQKDLVSFTLMAEYGGYFFDTTIEFTGSPKLTPVETPKVVLEPWSRGETGGTPLGASPWFSTDLWTFASPAGDLLFTYALKKYLDHYLNRIEEHNQNPKIALWADGETGTVGMICLISSLMNRFGIDVSDGVAWLEQHVPPLDGIEPKPIANMQTIINHSWPRFASLQQEDVWEVPELKLIKYHSSLWRKKNNQHNVEKIVQNFQPPTEMNKTPKISPHLAFSGIMDNTSQTKNKSESEIAVTALFNELVTIGQSNFPPAEKFTKAVETYSHNIDKLNANDCSHLKNLIIENAKDKQSSLHYLHGIELYETILQGLQSHSRSSGKKMF